MLHRWPECPKALMAAASNVSHFLIGLSPLARGTLNSATEKWVTLNTVSSVQLLASCTEGAFPHERSRW